MKIRVRHGEDEIELEGSDDFISARLTAFYEQLPKLTAAPPQQHATHRVSPRAPASKHKVQTPAEFYRTYGAPTDGVSQILVFAKYLEEVEGRSEFAVAEVNLAAKNAKLAKDIHPQYFSNAVKDGLLRRDQKGLYSLTVSAEERLSKPPGERSAAKKSSSRKRRAASDSKASDPSNSDAGKSSKTTARSTARPGAKATLARVYAEKFFKQPKTLNDIVQHADQNLASKFRASEFSGSLARYVRDGKLKRAKNADGQYEYTES